MKEKFENIKEWLIQNSLWLAGLGLMLASSGIDGYYMTKFNAWGAIGGYLLNTTSDITSMILMFWFGVFRQSNSQARKALSWGLLASEITAVVYSWIFSWRQLRPLIAQIETNPIWGAWEVEVLSFFFAGFIPLLLAFIGYAQGLQVGEKENPLTDNLTLSTVDNFQSDVSKLQSAFSEFQKTIADLQSEIKYLQLPIATLQDWRKMLQSLNGSKETFAKMNATDAVKEICKSHGFRFDLSSRTAYAWHKELSNE